MFRIKKLFQCELNNVVVYSKEHRPRDLFMRSCVDQSESVSRLSFLTLKAQTVPFSFCPLLQKFSQWFPLPVFFLSTGYLQMSYMIKTI